MNKQEWQNKLPKVDGEYKFAEPMSKHTWLGVGGNADVMYFPSDETDLQRFLQQRPKDVPMFVLGGGSNLLVRDGGISGIVIKLKASEFKKVEIIDGEILHCGSGVANATIKPLLINNALGGLEFICSIPGTLGGLLRTNAGCYGKDTSQVLQKAKIIDFDGNIKIVSPEEFGFSYRNSNFSKEWIVLEVWLKGEKSSSQLVNKLLEEQYLYRFEHQPYGIKTAGSTFKNPKGYSAWKLIKETKCDKLKIGGASFSPKHCNFLLNDGTATAEDIENLGKEVIRRVKKYNGVDMEWEIKIIGGEE